MYATCLLAVTPSHAQAVRYLYAPIEANAGFVIAHVVRDGKTFMSAAEYQPDTNRRGVWGLEAPSIKTLSDATAVRELVAEYFVETAKLDQPECFYDMVIFFCTGAQGMKVAPRRKKLGDSEGFVSHTGDVACIETTAGGGPCMDVKPIKSKPIPPP